VREYASHDHDGGSVRRAGEIHAAGTHGQRPEGIGAARGGGLGRFVLVRRCRLDRSTVPQQQLDKDNEQSSGCAHGGAATRERRLHGGDAGMQSANGRGLSGRGDARARRVGNTPLDGTGSRGGGSHRGVVHATDTHQDLGRRQRNRRCVLEHFVRAGFERETCKIVEESIGAALLADGHLAEASEPDAFTRSHSDALSEITLRQSGSQRVRAVLMAAPSADGTSAPAACLCVGVLTGSVW
jgi:hypothetical protein